MDHHDKFLHSDVHCKRVKPNKEPHKTTSCDYTGETEHQTWNSDMLRWQFEGTEDMGLGIQGHYIIFLTSHISEEFIVS